MKREIAHGVDKVVKTVTTVVITAYLHSCLSPKTQVCL